MNRRWLLLLALVAAGAGCAASEGATSGAGPVGDDPGDEDPAAGAPADRSVDDPAATTIPAEPAPERSTPSSMVEPEPEATAGAGSSYDATIRGITVEELGSSWRPGCPVAVEDLRRLDVRHWNMEGTAVDGGLVVHADHAEDLVTVFERLFDAGFPIHSLRPITDFDSDDDRSMAANNSSAFNCREIAGRPGVWSQHAYGGAVDLNPLLNPWVRGAQVDPPEGAVYVDRTLGEPGMVVAGDVVTQAFAAIGWHWGGDWNSTIDYQHFSHNGR